MTRGFRVPKSSGVSGSETASGRVTSLSVGDGDVVIAFWTGVLESVPIFADPFPFQVMLDLSEDTLVRVSNIGFIGETGFGTSLKADLKSSVAMTTPVKSVIPFVVFSLDFRLELPSEESFNTSTLPTLMLRRRPALSVAF